MLGKKNTNIVKLLFLIVVSTGCRLVCGIITARYVKTKTFTEKIECLDESANRMLNESPAYSVSDCGLKCIHHPECRRFRFDIGLRICTLYHSGENCIAVEERAQDSLCFRLKFVCEGGSCSRCPVGYYGNKCENIAKDCVQWKYKGYTLAKGLAFIRPNGVDIFEVFCNFKYNYLLIHNRIPECLDQDFNRTWNDYSVGFGKASGNHWLGLKNVHALLNQSPLVLYQLYVRVKTASSSYQCFYKSFNVGNEANNYEFLNGDFSPDTLGNALTKDTFNIVGRPFSTFDRDYSNGCPVSLNGGFWYLNSPYCSLANINGLKNEMRWINTADVLTDYVEVQLRILNQ